MLTDAETKAMNYAVGLLNLVMAAADESLGNQDVLRAANLLGFIRGAAFLLIHRAEVRYLLILAAILVYAGIYVRIAMIFAFIYLGIAKLDGVSLTFADSMVNALAMPFSFTNYPRDWVLQAAEFIHTLVVISLGVGALLTYLQRKLEEFQVVAGDLWGKLNQTEVRARMATAAKKAAVKPVASIAAQAEEVPPAQPCVKAP
jgi:hypothetical protein